MEERHAGHRHAILLVDDYDDVREAVTCELELDGCHVVAAASGPEALAILRAGYRPCVVLLDYVMPEMDGGEVRTRMHEDPALENVAVVMMSGDTSLVRDAGAIVAKPPREGEMQSAIAKFARCRRRDRSR